ncbi:hypothetical protein PG988_011848 [Apiospora saccharicola]
MSGFDKNFTFFTASALPFVPAAFVLLFLPKLYSFSLGLKYLDPADPKRYQPAILKADDLSDKVRLSLICMPLPVAISDVAPHIKHTKARILRAEAAFANGLETLAFYAAAVAAVNVQGLNPVAANVLSLLYLASRVVYNVVYVVLQDNPRWALVRSLTWFCGIGIIFAMFFTAGAAMQYR